MIGTRPKRPLHLLAISFTVLAVLCIPIVDASARCNFEETGESNYFEWEGKLASTLELAKSDNVAERIEAVRCMATFPVSQIDEHLLAALEDDSPDVQLAAVEAVGQVRLRSDVEKVMKLLDHTDSGVRASTAKTLGQLGDRSAVDRLIVALSDPSGDVRQATIHALGSLRDPKAIGPMTDALNDDARDVVAAALEELAEFGDETTVYAILDKTHDSSLKVKEQAVKALGELRDPRATSTLLGLLKGQPTTISRAAIKSLAQLGDPSAVEPLLAKLNPNDSPEILVSVINTLGALGDERAIDPLLGLVRHGTQTRAAASAIVEIGSPAVDILIEELEGADSTYRAELLRMLARIPTTRSAEILMEALQSERFPRDEVAMAVAQVRDPEMLEVLTLVIPDLSQKDLVKVLSRMQMVADDRLVAPLVQRYPELDADTRLVVLATFASIGDESALPVVLEEMGSEDPRIQRYAIHAAQRIGSDEAADPLASMLRYRDTDTDESRTRSAAVRRQAALALASIPGEKSIAKLLKAAESTDHPARREAMWALAFAVRGQTGTGEVQEFVRDVLEEPGHPLAYTALDTVATLGMDGVMNDFSRIYSDGRFSVRRKIVEVIGFMKNRDGAELVEQALTDNDRTLRSEAAWVVGVLGLESQNDVIVSSVEDPDPALATNAIATAGKLGLQDAVPVLKRRLYDANPFVAANSLWALQQLDATPEVWELELLLSRATNPFMRGALYEALEAAGASEVLERELARESSDTLRRQMTRYRDGADSTNETEWLVVDVVDKMGNRIINERAYFLMPDGSVKAAWSDENGKIRLELDEPGVVRQLYDRSYYEDFGVQTRR